MRLDRLPPEPTLADTLTAVMLHIALAQPDPAEREAMLAIMRKDGWIAGERGAA